MGDEAFLNWVADRLIYQLRDASNSTDYILRLRQISDEIARLKAEQ